MEVKSRPYNSAAKDRSMYGCLQSYIAILLVVAVLGCVAPAVPSYTAAHGSKEPTGKRLERRSTAMGADVHIYLFNLKTYKKKVLPAYQVFFRKDDPEALITLLRECSKILDTNPQLSERVLWDRESCEEDIGILTGTVYYSPDDGLSSNQGERKKTHKVRRDYARGLLSSNLLQVLCVPHDKVVNPAQDMSNTQLIQYLYKNSQWIEELLMGERQVRGGFLELKIGESSELFTKDDIQEFNAELKKVPAPESVQLRKEYDNLRALLNLALEDPNLTLVLTVG